jgi:hypothetical protein
MAAAGKDGKWGVVNRQGEWIIKAAYDNVATDDGIWVLFAKDKVTYAYGEEQVLEIPFNPTNYAGHWYVNPYKSRYGSERFNERNARQFLTMGIVDNIEGLRYIKAIDHKHLGKVIYDGSKLMLSKDMDLRTFPIYNADGERSNYYIYMVSKHSPIYKSFSKTRVEPKMYKLDSNRFLAKFEETYGIVDNDGKFVVKPTYTQLYYVPDGSFPMAANPNDHNEKPIDAVNLFPFKKDGKWGFMNRSGKHLIEAQFEAASFFSSGLAAVSSEGLFGFIDTFGNWVIKPQWLWVNDFQGDVAPVFQEGAFRFINKKGVLIGHQGYKQISFRHIAFECQADSEIHVVSQKGQLLTKVSAGDERQVSFDIRDVRRYYQKDSLVIFPSGDLQKRQVFKSLKPFDSENSIATLLDGRCGIFNQVNGDWTVPPEYTSITTILNYELEEALYYNEHYSLEDELNWEIISEPHTYKNGRWLKFTNDRELSFWSPDLKNIYHVKASLGQLVENTDWHMEYIRLYGKYQGKSVTYNMETGKYEWLNYTISRPYSGQYFEIESGNSKGCFEVGNDLLLKPVYDSILYYHDYAPLGEHENVQILLVKNTQGKWAVYSLNEKRFVTPFDFDRLRYCDGPFFFYAHIGEDVFVVDHQGHIYRPRQ